MNLEPTESKTSKPKNLKELFKTLSAWLQSNRTIAILIVGSLMIAVMWDTTGNATQKQETTNESPIDVDTFIPANHTLVPIEVQNVEALDSLFGQYGVVSLYSINPDSGTKNQLVAERVKMLRAPLNPSQFGILVRDSDAGPIVGHPGPLFVIVHPKTSEEGGAIVNTVTKTLRVRLIEEE